MKKYSLYGIILWLAIVAISLIYNINADKERLHDILQQLARLSYQLMTFTREWNSMHGGVYVPVSDKAEPNPNLIDKYRDQVTTDGIRLTMMNPAYMTRQISEISDKELGIKIHITSLKPIRPENKPHEWEKEALILFEKGEKDYHEIVDSNSGSEFRYMAPLPVIMSCLKCHAGQGYREGDIRGGISVIIPFENKKNIPIYITHLLAALIISVLIGVFGIKTGRYEKNLLAAKIRAEAAELDERELMRVLTHDLANTMGAILSIMEYSKTDKNILDEVSGEIYISAKNGFELINLVRKMRALTDNILELTDENLHEMIDNSLTILRHRIKEKNINIRVDIDKSLFVRVERTSFINSIMNNIISNAVKFSHPHSKIDISSSLERGMAVVNIRDYGIGMSPGHVAGLFDIKKNMSRPGTEGERGTGYGMPLIKKFLDIYAGKIEVESKEKRADSPDSGTTIRLYLNPGKNG